MSEEVAGDATKDPLSDARVAYRKAGAASRRDGQKPEVGLLFTRAHYCVSRVVFVAPDMPI